jgi:hypothetical protein
VVEHGVVVERVDARPHRRVAEQRGERQQLGAPDVRRVVPRRLAEKNLVQPTLRGGEKLRQARLDPQRGVRRHAHQQVVCIAEQDDLPDLVVGLVPDHRDSQAIVVRREAAGRVVVRPGRAARARRDEILVIAQRPKNDDLHARVRQREIADQGLELSPDFHQLADQPLGVFRRIAGEDVDVTDRGPQVGGGIRRSG